MPRKIVTLTVDLVFSEDTPDEEVEEISENVAVQIESMLGDEMSLTDIPLEDYNVNTSLDD